MPDLSRHAELVPSHGTIINFWSYEGGADRTMALANVGWILAANGHRVLISDWDADSPGLHHFYSPFLGDQEYSRAAGTIDMIRGYRHAAADADSPGQLTPLINKYAKVQDYTFSLDWKFADGGCIDILPPGRQNLDYGASISNLDWEHFYGQLSGGEFFDAMRADMARNYDFVLIDCPPGLSDFSGVCLQFADVLVVCFTLSTYSIEGAAAIAERTWRQEAILLPVPVRVDPTKKDRADAGRAFAMKCLSDLPAGLSEERRREYWNAVEVPYQASYSYEEMLAVFGDPPGQQNSVLASFERLTCEITQGTVSSLPVMNEGQRIRTRQQILRKLPLATAPVIIECEPEDQAWGEWIADVLLGKGIQVQERQLFRAATAEDSLAGPTFSVVSRTYASRFAQRGSQARPVLAICVEDILPPADLGEVPAVALTGLPESAAIELLHGLLASPPSRASASRKVRYPGREPAICNIPSSSARITGHEDCLRQIRQKLRQDRPGECRPAVLRGAAGTGQSQIALEYAHTFKFLYDLVWWIDCKEPRLIDTSLTHLAMRTVEVLRADPLVAATMAEAAQAAVTMLRGKALYPWLLIFDGADNFEGIMPYLSSGEGHIVITSQNPVWPDGMHSVEVGDDLHCN
jgi:cellulose biosynthesis protein BcsQ